MKSVILAVNAGSSSLKFKIFETGSLKLHMRGALTGIGLSKAQLKVTNAAGEIIFKKSPKVASQAQAADTLIAWLETNLEDFYLQGVGYRVVHGGQVFCKPVLVDKKTISQLKKIEKLAPLHLPVALIILSAFRKAFSNALHVASFDTEFHNDLPPRASYYPLPKKFAHKGIHRYGFHGLSCQYVIGHLQKSKVQTEGRKIIVAHLGSGASLTAIYDGKSMDTTMGFTPAGGIMMGTRSGDLDPGVTSFLLKHEGLSVTTFDELINKKSGLLGVSGRAADISTLIKREETDKSSALAVTMFCYSVQKAIGQFAAVLNGIDELIFTGGIGENIPEVRSRILKGMDYLQLQLDEKLNTENKSEIISKTHSKTIVRVIATDEEYILAKNVQDFL